MSQRFEPRMVVKVTAWGRKLPEEKIETSLVLQEGSRWVQTVAEYVESLDAFPIRSMEARVYEDVVLLA